MEHKINAIGLKNIAKEYKNTDSRKDYANKFITDIVLPYCKFHAELGENCALCCMPGERYFLGEEYMFRYVQSELESLGFRIRIDNFCQSDEYDIVL